ncbi:protein translocase subunit SecDF [Desulfogranum mediterraneum]|uniref:protein translocase subunit SecDF n=1 Tax=Desulfogranum mediterraneum TaxID=160661 RepID=UPI000408A62F|nr:protein translocase subunit SecDF [Desulfogranum mediterraneum]
MNTSLKLKIGLLLTLILFSLMTLAPSFYPSAPEWWKKYLAPEGLKLGLDLQGGMHLVLQVDLDKAIENSLDLSAADFKDGLAEQQISAVRMKSDNPAQVIFTLPNIGAVDTVQELVAADFPNLDVEVVAEEGSFPRISLQLKPEEIDFIRKNAVNQSLEIVRNRIDQFGVTEPVILRQGENEIVIQLPGVKDPDRAMGLIGQTAQLEFKLVADAQGVDLSRLLSDARAAGQWSEGESRKKLNLALQGRIPQGTEVYFERRINNQTKVESQVPILLESQVLMTGEMVKNAQVRIGGSFNEPYVSLDLTGRGGKLFAHITEKNVNRRLAIVLDEVVRSAPVIRERILGGSAQISGSFSHEEATDLAIVLRVGALPAPVEIIQNLTVGASLGQDSINKGLTSGLFGALLILVFMVIYYRLSGVIADISLTLNILFLFVGLAMLGATLTLPGIAGIILSIGMAVDANVLIFERMREEFALGKSIKSGVDSGFSKAFWSIVDSQVTTLITALALFMFGTGPIKGFAVTLSLGIIFNLFAVLFCSRLIYDSLYTGRRLKKLTFMRLIKKPNFDFMKVRRLAFVFSTVLVLIGCAAFVQILRGQANLGVDFSGGSLLQYHAQQPFSLEEVRGVLNSNGYPDIDLQEVTGENRLIVKLKKSEETVANLGEQLSVLLDREQSDKAFQLESQSEIGSSISAVLRNKAIQAIAISLIGVLFYLAIRFDFSFGLAAAAATFHDVLAVLGLCWLMNMEITLLIVTSLLTLAGYSLNDSVVVFDRIRENLKKEEEPSFYQLINTSINQVLSRSVVTSLTTAMVLLSLLVLGGSNIHDFAQTLLIGVLIGTYSSIFIASPLLSLKSR